MELIAERVQYYSKDEGLITESLKDYTRKNVLKEYDSLDKFLTRWNSETRKEIVIKELEEQGVIFEALKEEIGRAYDPFDLVCHVVYGKPALTRTERAEAIRDSDYFDKYGEKTKKVLKALLDKYEDEGLYDLENMEVLRLHPLNEFGTPIEIVNEFGDKQSYLNAISELEKLIYSEN